VKEDIDLAALNIELMDKRSVYQTPMVVLIASAIAVGIEAIALQFNLAILLGASIYVLRFALPMFAAYFLSGCRCGDGPFYMTTGGFLGAVGALVGGGIGLLLQGMILSISWFPTAMVAYIASMTPYILLSTLASFGVTYRWHSKNLEIVWSERYGSETGRTALEKLRARLYPSQKTHRKSTEQ